MNYEEIERKKKYRFYILERGMNYIVSYFLSILSYFFLKHKMYHRSQFRKLKFLLNYFYNRILKTHEHYPFPLNSQ